MKDRFRNLLYLQTNKDSLLIFAMIDTEENAKKLLEKSTEWRELNRFEFHDQMVLENLEKLELAIRKN